MHCRVVFLRIRNGGGARREPEQTVAIRRYAYEVVTEQDVLAEIDQR